MLYTPFASGKASRFIYLSGVGAESRGALVISSEAGSGDARDPPAERRSLRPPLDSATPK